MHDIVRLAIVTTHPIQYNAPWFKLLDEVEGITVKVFYTWDTTAAKFDPGFGKVIEWDLPLLEGYEYSFVTNVAVDKGSHHFKGINNPTLNQEIESWKADSVLVFGWAYKSHLACLRYFKNKIPVLFRGDSTLMDEKPGLKKIIRRAFLNYIYSKVDYALYVGENNKQYFLAHGLKESQLVFAPHAIDNDRFASNKYDERVSKKKSDLQLDNCFTILFAGKLEAKKNPGFLIKLANRLTDARFRFLIVGNGEMEQSLKESAANDKRIIFLDFQNQQEMPVIYRLCDVFILPSRGPQETWGLAINEAMACGKPVITTYKTGCAPDLIKGNGLVINPDDVNNVAEYIHQLSSDGEYYSKQSEASKKIMVSYSYDAIINNITVLLKKIQIK
jgi:glycosyltransferase involved in cell wall biosynthesis